jgi:fatty acid/phospholipid biosynthesis enzyme
MVNNTIAIDAMGGDNSPKSVIAGLAISSVRNPGVEYIVYGDENKLIPLLKKRDNLKKIVKVVHVDDWIRADEKASKSLRRSKTTSMGLAIAAVANGEAGAIVSAGNSGALLAMSIFGLRKLSGISRPALAAIMPTVKAGLLIPDNFRKPNIDIASNAPLFPAETIAPASPLATAAIAKPILVVFDLLNDLEAFSSALIQSST